MSHDVHHGILCVLGSSWEIGKCPVSIATADRCYGRLDIAGGPFKLVLQADQRCQTVVEGEVPVQGSEAAAYLGPSMCVLVGLSFEACGIVNSSSRSSSGQAHQAQNFLDCAVVAWGSVDDFSSNTSA